MTFRDNNGRELLFDGEFAMTKQSVSIFSGAIKGDVSISFRVDNNSVNRAILNYKGPQMLNQVAFTKQPFSRMDNGNFIDSGYIVIQEEEDQFLKCFYLSGNSNWMQLLDGLVTELDYSGITNGKDYNKTLTQSNVQSNTAFDLNEGIVFPFIDWCFSKKKGNNSYSILSNVDGWRDIENDLYKPLIQFYPCFFLHSLVKEIFNQAGIKTDGNLFSDALYKTLAIPPVDGKLKRDSFKKVLLSGSSQTYSAGVGVYEKIGSLTLRQGDSSTWDDSLKRFTTPIKSTVNIGITMTSESGTSNINIRVYKNGINILVIGGIELGIKHIETLDFSSYSNKHGDYFELYVTDTVGSPFSAAFDIEYEMPENILFQDSVEPSNFLPELKCIDIIKFLISFFGCSVYFDSTSKTITFTIIEKLKPEEADNWSDYYISHSPDYSENAAHNFINWDKSSDSDIEKYNSNHTLKFGSGDIQTGNTLLDQKQIAKFPFAPSLASVGFNNVYCLNIPLINLVDEGDPIPFTSIALLSTPFEEARFTTGVPSVLHDREVVRITNGNGVNIGYYMAKQSGGGATYEDIIFPFKTTDTGKIWRQKIEYQQIEPRIISIKPSSSKPTEFSVNSIYNYENGVGKIIMNNIGYAAFSKTITNLTIDQWKNNLAIDNPDSGNFTDPTIKELYFNKISNFINNPPIRTIMRLPDSVYQRFKFDQFIYLRTEKLTGYFFVESIDNYVDSNTPVKIDLYML